MADANPTIPIAILRRYIAASEAMFGALRAYHHFWGTEHQAVASTKLDAAHMEYQAALRALGPLTYPAGLTKRPKRRILEEAP